MRKQLLVYRYLFNYEIILSLRNIHIIHSLLFHDGHIPLHYHSEIIQRCFLMLFGGFHDVCRCYFVVLIVYLTTTTFLILFLQCILIFKKDNDHNMSIHMKYIFSYVISWIILILSPLALGYCRTWALWYFSLLSSLFLQLFWTYYHYTDETSRE